MKRCLLLIVVCWNACLFAQSYSLLDFQGVPLDHKIATLLHRERGVFVEVGAHDGVTQSNTKLLEEEYRWVGICVEPSSVLFEQLKENRPGSACYCCALGSFKEEGSVIYGDFDGKLMSSVAGERLHREASVAAPVRSLQSILDELQIFHIDFFSLDTEGYEYQILQGIDFNKTTFDYLLIEIYNDQYDAIVDFLGTQGYDCIENFSNYSLATNPYWDGLINDYLFKRRDY